MVSNLKVDKIQSVAGDNKVHIKGHILQVDSVTKLDDHYQSASQTFTDVPGVSIVMTPKFISSKFLITVSGVFGNNTSSRMSAFNITRNGTVVGTPPTMQSQSSTRTLYHNGTDQLHQMHIEFMDSPATTDQLTYKLQMKTNASGILYLGTRSSDDARQGTTMTVMEVAQ